MNWNPRRQGLERDPVGALQREHAARLVGCGDFEAQAFQDAADLRNLLGVAARELPLAQIDAVRFTAGQGLLGEPLWRPPSPKGYGDDEATWIDGMGRRLDVANNFAERVAGRLDPSYVMETVLASTISGEVTQAVARAESRQQALALLFMSPEFQRR